MRPQKVIQLLVLTIALAACIGAVCSPPQVMDDTSSSNTAVAGARDPVKMALAMRYGIEAGRLAFEAGRIPRKLYATASSPTEGAIEL